ncbi:RCC1/BLIP-II [Wolfiporia cocos MD-104 SS10]|uniref:RCC1/BLIP-II n=1 Tax=Wolfiporia cocos (strain MD-104) TaxID=742152 RepID=A0A2H3JDK6_WOLCO|nr:RCC1/BLIP-II [Wolfiporia cocos MD-104 SS10]
MPQLSDMPVELLLHSLFPILPVSDILHLSTSNRFFYQLTSDETFWCVKTREDFQYKLSLPLKNMTWKHFYKRLWTQKVFVWGNKQNLGYDEDEPIEPSMRYVPFPVPVNIPHASIIDLTAGESSFHALDSAGNIHVWGQLSRTSALEGLDDYGFESAFRRADRPMRLNLPTAFCGLSCGYAHCVALDISSTVWLFTQWGRPMRLITPELNCASPDVTPVQIESGWTFAAVLTSSGDVVVYWPSSHSMRSAAEVSRRNSHSNRGPIITTETEPNMIPCEVLDINARPVRLPTLPCRCLPDLTGTGLSEELQNAPTKLIKIAGLDGALIGLTNKGHVVRYNGLISEYTYQHDYWEYLPKFSDVREIRDNYTFRTLWAEPPETMHITNISAQRHAFAAWTTSGRSIVLTGEIVEATTPVIRPALLDRAVTDVVFGNAHYGVLTAPGKLLTWGSCYDGVLGLGNPMCIPVGKPGGYASIDERLDAIRRGNEGTPPDVIRPAEVMFYQGRNARDTFCYAVAAAGRHMAALVSDSEVRCNYSCASHLQSTYENILTELAIEVPKEEPQALR